jgi:hypothetical protein
VILIEVAERLLLQDSFIVLNAFLGNTVRVFRFVLTHEVNDKGVLLLGA